MKKIATLFFFFFIILLCQQSPHIDSVFLEEKDNQMYHTYEITLKENKVTTYNMLKFIKNLQVLTIEPSLNPIYKNKISATVKVYHFTSDTPTVNIQKFTSRYFEQLQNHGFLIDLNKQKVMGIPIYRITLFCQKNEIYHLNEDVIDSIKEVMVKD